MDRELWSDDRTGLNIEELSNLPSIQLVYGCFVIVGLLANNFENQAPYISSQYD